MTEEDYKYVSEILADAENSARLTQWEEEFCDDMRAKILAQGADYPISDRQWQIIERIEEKIYR